MGSDEHEFPDQQQQRPGREGDMSPAPRAEMRPCRGTGKREGKVALVTGGDSGIGRAVCAAFAKEGADLAIAYLTEDDDAEHPGRLVEAGGRGPITLPGELTDESHAVAVVRDTVEQLVRLGVLVNHAGTQT